MTMARLQHFCRANNKNLGYFDGIRVFPRTNKEKKCSFKFTQQSVLFNMQITRWAYINL